MPFLTLSNLSRYKDTAVFDEAGALEFGLAEPAPEFEALPLGARQHRVKQNEVGFLDIIAATYYGVGYETMWWVIAQANGMLDPETEMYAGMSLAIPPRSAVVQFIARLGDAG